MRDCKARPVLREKHHGIRDPSTDLHPRIFAKGIEILSPETLIKLDFAITFLYE
jgi:hypothetical protein